MDIRNNLEILYNISKSLDCFDKNTNNNLSKTNTEEKYEICFQLLEKSETIVLCKDKILNHNSFKVFHDLHNKNKKLLKELDKIKLEKGVTQCKVCGCEKNIIETKQTRASDELTTVFVKCGNCDQKWIL